MAEKELKLGDVVCLNSDKRLLMVVGLIKNKECVARCYWFYHGELKDSLFPLATLEVDDTREPKEADEEYVVGDVVRLKSDTASQQVMTIAHFLNRRRAECFWFHEGEQKVGNCPLCTLTQTQPVGEGKPAPTVTDKKSKIEPSKAQKAAAKEEEKTDKKTKASTKKSSGKKTSKAKQSSKRAPASKKSARKAASKKKKKS